MREVSDNKIFTKARERFIPLNATFELTYRCNLSCVHCYLEEDTNDELTTVEVFSVIDQLAQCGTLNMTFTGGEALLRDDFFDIACHARKRNMAVSLISNGTLIEEGVVEEMKSLHFSNISISLYGITPATHEAVTGVAGSFSRTVKTIKLLAESGFKITVKTSIMKQNVDEIARIDDFCNGVGAELSANPSLCPTSQGSMRPLNYRLSDEELKRYMIWEVDNKEVKGLTRTCNAGLCNVGISPKGDVFPCNALRLTTGNLRKQSVEEVWNSSPSLQRIRGLKMEDFGECFRCKLLDICVRCPWQALREEGDLLVSLKESCRIARIRKEEKDGKSNP